MSTTWTELLRIVIVPLTVFLVLYLFVRRENAAIDPAVRYRLAVVAGWLFLVVPVLQPYYFGQLANYRDALKASACGVCALGLGIAALRLPITGRSGALALFLIATGLTLRDLIFRLGEYLEHS